MALVLLGAQAQAQQELTGSTPSGANYTIRVPEGWQVGDTLVLYQHGFNFSPIDDTPSLGPLAQIMLAQGYAVAASSFSQRGWAVFRAVEDNRQLVEAFSTRVGAPGAVIPWGGSLGGLIALKIAEAPDFPPIPGVYSICPAAAGSRLWDQALDLRLAYDVICEGSGDLPEGDMPLPWAIDYNDIPDDLDNLFDQASLLQVLVPLNQCTGINLPPALRSSNMRRRLAELMRVAGTTDEDFFITNFGYATYALAELVRAPDKLDGRNPFTTVGVDYGDAEINSEILRLSADPLAALQLRWTSDFRGDIGEAKVLSLHTSRDELVIPANQSVLRQRIAPTRLTSAIVAEPSPSHCGFTEAEAVAGWLALRDWIEDDAAQPDVADLQSQCTSIVGVGADGPCRFDATFDVPTIDSRIKPRPPLLAAAVDAGYSGQWYDPARIGEGIVLEVLPGNRALLYFFTYPPPGVTGNQAWLLGTGNVTGNGIVFEQMYRPVMVPNGNGGERLEQQPWGSLWLSFDDCRNGQMRWQGPPLWGNGDVTLERLTVLDGTGCIAPVAPIAQPSGAWFDTRFFGNGFVIEQLDAVRTGALWFSPGTVGAGQTWMTGILEGNIATGVSSQLLYRPSGPRFGDAFDPALFTTVPAMTIDLRLGCGLDGAGQYVTTPLLPGSGSPLQLERITRPLGIPGCP